MTNPQSLKFFGWPMVHMEDGFSIRVPCTDLRVRVYNPTETTRAHWTIAEADAVLAKFPASGTLQARNAAERWIRNRWSALGMFCAGPVKL